MDNIHYCLRCSKPFTCPVGSRRRYCEPCQAILEQEGGGRTPTKWTKGHGPRAKAKRPPVVIDAIVVSRHTRPGLVLDDA